MQRAPGFLPLRGRTGTPETAVMRPRRISRHGNHGHHNNAKLQRDMKAQFHVMGGAAPDYRSVQLRTS